MSYLLFFQPIDENTDPANASLSGEIFDLEELLDEKGAGRASCDGQVSPTPPRHSNDNMMGLYFESKQVAEEFSAALREDVRRRISSGQLNLRYNIPWASRGAAAYTTAALEHLALESVAKYVEGAVTESQIVAAAEACARDLGRMPTADEFFRWCELHRNFPTR